MAVDFADIQGLVGHAYRSYPHALYLLLRFEDPASAARDWLAELVTSDDIDSAMPKETSPGRHRNVRVNVAFTYTGLQRLGLDSHTLAEFPAAFTEGLGRPWTAGAPDHRSRILGDVEESDPRRWDWGFQADDRRVDALLLVFGLDASSAEAAGQYWLEAGKRLGVFAPTPARALVGSFPGRGEGTIKEPFGFVDGVSQPVMKGIRRQLRLGSRRTQPAIHEIEDGEMLLGHRDGARQLPPSPTVLPHADPQGVLPRAISDGFTTPVPGAGDLGANGTYLVFRQLEQDAAGFETQCVAASGAAGVTVAHYKALLVGRWEDGSPLVTCPLGPDDRLAAPPSGNDFGYGNDPHGSRCPIGAHIRRANPRDSLVEDPAESWRISNRHRILRRGRPYEVTDPTGRLTRGLHFICLNADIVRQFEFIQQNWLNDPTFGGLPREVDPLVGRSTGAPPTAKTPHAMTLPPAPNSVLPRRTALGRYVTVKGGGYFFLPSLTALQYLSGLGPRSSRSKEWQPPARPTAVVDAIRVLMHARFSVLLAAVLPVAPLTLLVPNAALLALLEPMFRVDRWWHLSLLTTATSLTASVAMLTWRTVQLHAQARFDLRTGWTKALTWGRVARWQSLTIPWVLVTVILSRRDGVLASASLWVWVLVVLGGYAAAFLLMALAEVLRGRSVHDSNSEDTVILPPTLGRRLRKYRPASHESDSPPVSGSKDDTVAGAIRSFTALVPPEKGRGYIDHRSGRVLPGHLSGVLLAAVAAVVLLVVRFTHRPWDLWFGVQLPPSVYLLTALSIATFAAAAAAFWLDRYRVPLLALIVVWVVLSGTFRDGDHRFPLAVGANGERLRATGGLPAREALSEADKVLGGGKVDDPVVVVAAGGGGAFQAAWVARVLAGLTEEWDEAFSRRVRLVSGTSGGAVGAMHFLNRYGASAVPTRTTVAGLVDAAASPSTGDVWWGLTYYDLVRVLPVRVARDRGWALERAWERSLKPDSERRTLGQWQADVAGGWRPAMAFNAMAVETGERVALATYQLPGTPAPKSVTSVTDGHDIDVVTAARLSASFPYVTPFARADTPKTLVHLADGGYWDNHGVATVLEWLRATEPDLDRRRVVFIRIPPPLSATSRPRDRSWGWQLTAPVTGLESMRTNAQGVRGDEAIDGYKRERAFRQASGGPPLDIVTFAPPANPSLSWHVSAAERCRIDRDWDARFGTERAQVEAALGRPAHRPGRPRECGR